MRNYFVAATVVILLVLARGVPAAETVHLTLKANGAIIQGDSSYISLGRENTIECVYYDASGGTLSNGTLGKRSYTPIVIRKRIDKSSPLLYKAMALGQNIDGVFKFYRPSPIGDGSTEQFYTITIATARLVTVRQYVPDCLDPASASLPPLEEVTFVFAQITWSYSSLATQTEYTDTVSLPPVSKVSGEAWRQYGQTPLAPAKPQTKAVAPEKSAMPQKILSQAGAVEHRNAANTQAPVPAKPPARDTRKRPPQPFALSQNVTDSRGPATARSRLN